MLENMLDKYSNNTLRSIDEENMIKIINFLQQENCYYIEDIIEDYLDLFTIEYDLFVEKYNKLAKKYNNHYLELAGEDMNLLEEFFLN